MRKKMAEVFSNQAHNPHKKLDIAGMVRANVFFSVFVGLVTFVGVLVINAPGWERLQPPAFLVFLLSLILWVFLRRGYERFVAYGMVWGNAAAIIFGAVTGVGVRGTAYAAFSIVVMLGALLIHRRVGYLIAALSTLFGLGLVGASRAGWLPNADQPLPDLAVWTNVSIYFFVTAVILDITLRQVDRALQEQARAEEDLRQLNTELEARIEKRTAQLAESEARYRLIAEHASDVIWTLDLNLNITYLTPSAERMRGYTIQEQKQQTISEALTPESYERARQILAEELPKVSQAPPNYFRTVELEFYRKDGSTYWSEVKVSLLRDENGLPIGLLGVGRNIDKRKQAEKALRESEARHRLISTLSSDYAFSTIVHPNGELEVDWVLDSFEVVSGYSLEEYQARGGWPSILHPDSLESNAQAMTTLRANKPVDVEMKIITKNGEERWVRFYAHPVWDEKENCLCAIHGAGKDITTEKQAQAREIRRREMLEKVIAMGQTVTQQTDLSKCLKEIHHSIKFELGFDRVGLMLYDPVSNELQDAFSPEQVDDIEDSSWYLRSIAEHQTWNMVMKTPKGLMIIEELPPSLPAKPDEKTRPMRQHATLAAWAGEKPVALIAVDNALTRTALTQEKLEALKLFAGYAGLAIENARWNRELEKRVIERTSELEAANQELQDFTYTIAHDLRAPARSMIGFSRLLQEEYARQIDQDGQHYLNRVYGGAQRMGKMIDELLAFTHLGRQPLHLEPVNMRALVCQVLEEFEPERVGRQVEIKLGDLPDIHGDQEMLELVWRHLLSNAFKFTRKTPHVEIEIGTVEKQGGLYFFIRDNGIGFDMKYAEKIFGVFNHLNLEEEYEGTGMGLAIVQRIITRHGGRIWAEAKINHGATLFFTL